MLQYGSQGLEVVKNINSILLKTTLFVCLFPILTSFYPFRPGEYGLRKVVIDAGHGGKDPGAIGVDGMREKDVTLDIALEVGKSIKKAHPDVEVIYTRETDVFITLNGRARKANEINADLFMSVHADAAASSQAYGTETFALGLHRSKENLETAKRENKVILMEDNYEVHYEGFDPTSDESYIAISLQQSAHLEQSLSIASKVQDQFKSIGRRNRGVKQAGFLVLYKTTMPSVLIETGFITNQKEGRFLNQKENRLKIANCIVSAFSDYKNEVDGQYVKDNQPEGQVNSGGKANSVTADSGVRFRVQIASSPTPVKLDPKNFKGFSGVKELKVGGSYKYTIGDERTFEEGVDLQAKVRQKGYKDAFLIGVYKGERIPISKAKELNRKAN